MKTWKRTLHGLLLLGAAGSMCLPAHAVDLAIVIDDIGHNYHRDQAFIHLPAPLNLSFLPFASASARLAREAHARGHEVLLHQPMQYRETRQDDEPGNLHLGMPAHEFAATLDSALAALPFLAGVNNHTGSLLTRHVEPMQQVMSRLAGVGLYFLDSRTTHHTVALDVAHAMAVPATKRDVFLDNDPSIAGIDRAFHRALKIARRQGHAVIIGHPYRTTMDYLAQRLPTLDPDVRLVRVSTLIRDTRQSLAMPTEATPTNAYGQ